MMCSYQDPGFPFYYVNQRMLDYLGYGSEAEFVRDISGLIINCVHPDDWAEVERQVAAQMGETGEYTVEYRMRKKNGDYIWVHDIGRSVTAENGKPVIISVCVDITALHTAQEDRREMLNTIPGAVLRCRYAEGLEVMDTSDVLYSITGYTSEKFAQMGNRLSALLLPEDAEKVLPSFRTQLAGGADSVYMIGLNATIEAARLGQTGKTIAVVAEEIRKLADTTKLTVASIDSIKEAIEKSVSSTVHSANDTLNSTSEQAAAMEELSAAVQSSSSLAELLKDMSQKH